VWQSYIILTANAVGRSGIMWWAGSLFLMNISAWIALFVFKNYINKSNV